MGRIIAEKYKNLEEQIKEKLTYEKETGRLFWKKTRSKKFLGKEAGHVHLFGYRVIAIQGKVLFAHRIVWFLEYGRFPYGEIDHINGIKTDNKIENLRDVSRRENAINRKTNRERCGMFGYSVFKKAKINKYGAFFNGKIRGKRKTVYLGAYGCELQASMASEMFRNGESVFNRNIYEYGFDEE